MYMIKMSDLSNSYLRQLAFSIKLFNAEIQIGEFPIPGRPRTSASFCAKVRLMRVTSLQEDKQT